MTKDELQIALDVAVVALETANTQIGILEEKLEAFDNLRADLKTEYQDGIDELTTQLAELTTENHALAQSNEELQTALQNVGVKVYVAPEPEPELKLCKGSHSYWPIEDFEDGSDYCKDYLTRTPVNSEAVVIPKSKRESDRVVGAQPGLFPKDFVKKL
jgi:regulator of replication initiation timing